MLGNKDLQKKVSKIEQDIDALAGAVSFLQTSFYTGNNEYKENPSYAKTVSFYPIKDYSLDIFLYRERTPLEKKVDALLDYLELDINRVYKEYEVVEKEET